MKDINPSAISVIYEIHLTVRNLEFSIGFYNEILGLELACKYQQRSVAFFLVLQTSSSMLRSW
jgi:lactoylglutathione lyase